MSKGPSATQIAKKQLLMSLLPEMEVKSPILYNRYRAVRGKYNPWFRCTFYAFICTGLSLACLANGLLFNFYMWLFVILVMFFGPQRYRQFETRKGLILIVTILTIFSGVVNYDYIFVENILLLTVLYGCSACAAYLFCSGYARFGLNERVSYWQNSILKNYQMSKAIKEELESERIETMNDKLDESIASSTIVGDVIINGDNNPVVISSRSVEIVQGTKQTQPELAKTLSLIVGHVVNKEQPGCRVF